jgi:hypothetical protein
MIFLGLIITQRDNLYALSPFKNLLFMVPSLKIIFQHLNLLSLYLALGFLSSVAQAEFIMTTPSGVYQSDDGRTKIILSHRENSQGIFIAHFEEPIPPQEFNPERLPTAESTHVFIKFDPNSEYQYSEVIIGERRYKITGNLNILLNATGSVSVNIDNMNPYLTVTHRYNGSKNEALVGFYGMTEVVKGSGNLATILAANQLSPETQKILKPYTAGASGALLLGNKEVATPTVGLYVPREHECTKLPPEIYILTLEQLKAIQRVKIEAQQVQILEGFLKENKNRPPTSGFLILRAQKKQPMILLSISSKNIFDMRLINNTFSKQNICVISPVG